MPNALSARNVAVVGAGIAGLTAAIALARRGARVTVLERADALREVGAGIQVSPNAVRALRALDLLPGFQARAALSEQVILRDLSGAQVARLDFARHRPNDSFYFIHRARLQDLLAGAAQAAGADIRLNREIAAPPEGFDLVVAADGLKSALRPVLNGTEVPFFTGQTAWRAVIADTGDAAPQAEVFMGPGRHLVSYPLGPDRLGRNQRNIVAVIERPDWHEEGWSHAGDPADLRAAFARFAPRVGDWLARVDQAGIWGLFRHPVATHWQDGRLVLIGDAAHPTLPFMAQGAVMAIEDAWVLAACLDADHDQAAALARFQSLRQPRCTRIVEAANKNARNYHLRGPARAVAHAGLRGLNRFAPASLIERFGWLYDYDPTQV
ncbi:FAD-dependent oxidoreductase [Paracoccus sp. DMF-8]|uniref:FAD-dependent oxidoreductase n=1 Tax=Paracoccus sp. DMF-8 TaxID=3019445 RepID=UPI0023E37596|nr:FAD-dependent oxidoreductase [Paracoccus sp. DMF-8]MDF3607802.1 FAD-dependent oxidoreductase [Paracoccus sp. DMF-8]